MQITAEQNTILASFKCVRVREVKSKILDSISGAEVNGRDLSHIINVFRHPCHISDDIHNNLASYLILSPDDIVLAFFSLRCGELFEKVDHEKFRIARAALDGLKLLSQRATDLISTVEQENALAAIREAKMAGLSFDDLSHFIDKKSDYVADEGKEPNKLVSRVSKVHSGVELKFYGTNEAGKPYWSKTGLHRKMGLTLYWRFIIPKLEELQKVAGCQYMYLFAADKEADGRLVNYYRTALHINANHNLSANKPHFDYTSVFLYQEISELLKQRDYFFNTFNIDNTHHDII